jgi:hypothetical protein
MMAAINSKILTLPIYIDNTKIILEATVILLVIPVDKPTVAKAEITSNRIGRNSNLGSKEEIKMVIKTIDAAVPKTTATAFKIKVLGTCR